MNQYDKNNKRNLLDRLIDLANDIKLVYVGVILLIIILGKCN